MQQAPELAVVLPVFNEQDCLASVLDEWMLCLKRSGATFVVLVLDDGSTDNTPTILREATRIWGPSLKVVRHENIGHGQTCLLGYRLVCQMGASYALQIDSDGQCDPGDFETIWKLRKESDLIFGIRTKRKDGWKRRAASNILRAVMAILFGIGCRDPNTPFRLMKTERLAKALGSIPTDFVLANIALTVQLERISCGSPRQIPIQFRKRMGGLSSVSLLRFPPLAFQLCLQLAKLPHPDVKIVEVATSASHR